jgi:hypothetical protein
MIRYSGMNLFFPKTSSVKNKSISDATYPFKLYDDANVASELSVEPDSKSADPKFVNPANNNLKNFKLESDSPAILELGFKPIDFSKVGTDW